MKELQELRNEVLSLRKMGELTKQTESILLHKLNTLQEAINYTRCCKSGSEQLCSTCGWCNGNNIDKNDELANRTDF